MHQFLSPLLLSTWLQRKQRDNSSTGRYYNINLILTQAAVAERLENEVPPCGLLVQFFSHKYQTQTYTHPRPHTHTHTHSHTHTHTLQQGWWLWAGLLRACAYLGEWHSVANCHMATLNIVGFNKRVHTLAINKLVWGSLGYHELSDFSLCPRAAQAWWSPAECHFRSDSSLQQQEVLCPADRTEPLVVILPFRCVFGYSEREYVFYVLEQGVHKNRENIASNIDSV